MRSCRECHQKRSPDLLWTRQKLSAAMVCLHASGRRSQCGIQSPVVDLQRVFRRLENINVDTAVCPLVADVGVASQQSSHSEKVERRSPTKDVHLSACRLKGWYSENEPSDPRLLTDFLDFSSSEKFKNSPLVSAHPS